MWMSKFLKLSTLLVNVSNVNYFRIMNDKCRIVFNGTNEINGFIFAGTGSCSSSPSFIDIHKKHQPCDYDAVVKFYETFS